MAERTFMGTDGLVHRVITRRKERPAEPDIVWRALACTRESIFKLPVRYGKVITCLECLVHDA